MTDQLDIFAGETPLPELDWPPILRDLSAHERELGVRLTADEAGAWLHARDGKHDSDQRCGYCAPEGRELLRRRGRLDVGGSPGQTGISSRLADDPAPPTSSASRSGGRARSSDPGTSHAAARSLTAAHLRDSQEAILRLFRELGPMSDDLLVDRYREAELEGLRPTQSPSGIRTRRHELVDAGALVDSGKKTRLESGRNAIVWALATEAVREYAPEPEL